MSLQVKVAHVIGPVCVIRKALESLAVRDTGDCQRVGERARRDMDALQQALNKKMADLEQVNVYTFIMYVGLKLVYFKVLISFFDFSLRFRMLSDICIHFLRLLG